MAIKAFSEIKESNMVSNPEFSSSTLSHIIVNFYYTSMLYLVYNPNHYQLANSMCRVHPYFSCRCALLVCVVLDRNGGNINFRKTSKCCEEPWREKAEFLRAVKVLHMSNVQCLFIVVIHLATPS